jgi:cytochrome c oxidase subunit III
MSSTELTAHSGGHGAPLPPGHFHHMEPEQAYSAAKFGMWLFLATEVLFFGGLFAAFGVFNAERFEEFHQGAQYLDWRLGGLNTVVLLVSSFFMAMGVDAAQHGQNKKVIKCLIVTLICGVIFMVVKYFEYTHKFHIGIFPWTNIYFGLYFAMTGLHGIHVVIGLGLILWLIGLAKKDRFSETYYTPVEVGGLYWHLVDLIWIYLFPLLYLIKY